MSCGSWRFESSRPHPQKSCMAMSIWQLRSWRLQVAIDRVESIVDKHDGFAKMNVVVNGMLAMPKSDKFQQLHDKGKLQNLLIAAAKKSKVLGILAYCNKSGDRKLAFCRIVAGAAKARKGSIA